MFLLFKKGVKKNESTCCSIEIKEVNDSEKKLGNESKEKCCSEGSERDDS